MQKIERIMLRTHLQLNKISLACFVPLKTNYTAILEKTCDKDLLVTVHQTSWDLTKVKLHIIFIVHLSPVSLVIES